MGADCQRLDQEIEHLMRQNEMRVIFDLSGVAQIDSGGMGKIVRCFSKLKKSGGSLRLAGADCGKELLTHCPNKQMPGSLFRPEAGPFP